MTVHWDAVKIRPPEAEVTGSNPVGRAINKGLQENPCKPVFA